MLDALLNYRFLQNALLAALLASIACGIIGSLIVEKKFVMISGGIAHTAFGGVGLGYFLNFEPMIGALLFSVLAALGIKTIENHTKTYTDVLIGIFWSLGMSLGILFISFTPGYPPNMTSYLFGDILTVTNDNLIFIGILDILILLTIIGFYHQWQAFIFDTEFATILKIPVKCFDYLLYILVAITVVILIRIVGIILVISLLTTAPSLAKQYTFNFKYMLVFSVLLGALFCVLGLIISFKYNIPSGASIVLVSVLIFLIGSLFKKLLIG